MPRFYILLAATSMAALAGCSLADQHLTSSPAASSLATASSAVPVPTVWQHEVSDVAPDPAIRFGKLPNGMRYALRRNVTPPGEASMHLYVDAGSLVERDGQLGLAHFMEHMVFNGTQNLPEGEFVRRLERLGMSFGGHTNASTGFEETIYSLSLPDTRAEVVDAALNSMREAADKALLATAAIDRERGVVLSEERASDGPGARAARKQFDFLLKDQLPAKRFPIGTVDIIRNAPRERFVEFYEAWYRPENVTLVVVGDFDVDEVETKIRAQFGDWRGQGPAGVRPDLGVVAKRGLEVSTFVEEGADPLVTVVWSRPPEDENDTHAVRIKDIRQNLAFSVLNRRLGRMALRIDPPFVQAEANSGTSLHAITQTAIAATFAGGEWRPALEAIDQEQRRIAEFGVGQLELDGEIKRMRQVYENGLAGATTRYSSALAGDILNAISGDLVVTTPADRLSLYEEAVRDFDAAKASEILRERFRGEGPLVLVSSPEPIAQGEVAIRQAFEQSRNLAVAPPATVTAKAWAYTDFGQPGHVVERHEVADVRATFIRFANGTRLTVRPSATQKNQIMVSVNVGDGKLDLPADQPSISWAARPALIEGGLSKMTLEEIDDALAGRNYGANFSINEDKFQLSASTQPADLALQLQVLAAFVTDPGWRTEGLEREKSTAFDKERQYEATAGSVLAHDLPGILRGGDQRFATPSAEVMRATTMATIRKELAPIFEEPIEVVIVGNVSVDEAVAQTAKTFGALPVRRDAGFAAEATQVYFPQARSEPLRLTHGGRADQAMGYLAWPTDGFFADPQKARALRVLAAVLQLRLTDEFREKQAVTYSPGVGADSSWTFPSFGYVAAAIEAPLQQLEPFFDGTLKISSELRDKPVSADEFRRALNPLIESLQSSQESNGYWLAALSGVQTDPRQLNAARTAMEGLQRVTIADVQRVADEYLREDKAFKLVVEPRVGASPL